MKLLKIEHCHECKDFEPRTWGAVCLHDDGPSVVIEGEGIHADCPLPDAPEEVPSDRD